MIDDKGRYAYGIFGDARYERLAVISVAHLYNLRRHAGYQRLRQVWAKTRPVTVAIGERRAPSPNHQPGYLRVDSVHQGDQDGIKGVYHINGPRPPRTVDCVTQYEGVATCERMALALGHPVGQPLSEAFLIPVLEALLDSFPFVIKGVHSDNGSEYINHDVAKLLNKLLIEEQTKSRSRHSNDNAQAESKNGSIVRKHLGYSFWFAKDGVKRRMADKPMATFKQRIRQLTRRSGGRSMAEVIDRLKPYLMGWKTYFGLAQTPRVWQSLDEWLRHRLRAIHLKHWKRGSTIYRELINLGAAEHVAKRVAGNSRRWWRNSAGELNRVLTIAYFDKLGVPRLS